jgi:hypothetical protein
MSGDVRKIGSVLPVSQQVLADALDLNSIWQRLMQPDTRTPYQRERDQLAREADGRKARNAIRAAHAAALRAVDSPALVAVLELHAPVFGGLTDTSPHCEGCDMEGYEVEWPAFPCRTYELITK